MAYWYNKKQIPPQTGMAGAIRPAFPGRSLGTKCKYLIFCTVFILFSGRNLQAADDIKWKLIGNRNKVLIFADENPASQNRMYKAMFDVSAPVEKVVSMLNDPAGYKEWVPGSSISDVVSEKKTNETMNGQLIHVGFDFGWPVTSRDFVAMTRINTDTDGGTFTLEMDATDKTDIMPPNDAVRMKQLQAKFEGEYLGGNKTRMVLFLSLDPGDHAGDISAEYISVKILRNIAEGMLNTAPRLAANAAIPPKNAKSIQISGYAESENYTRLNHAFLDSYGKERSAPQKTEGHVKLDLNTGTDPVMMKAILHAYGYIPGDSDTDSSYTHRVDIAEMMVSYFNPLFDIQAGKQIIKWGTADTINPTSYFNPYDLSENLLKDNDELFRGVYALSGRIMLSDSSVQAVIVPVHTPARLPGNDSSWQLTFPVQHISGMTLPVVLEQSTDKLETSLENTAFGLRYTRSRQGMDYSLSFFHGPDRDVELKPELMFDPLNPALTHIAMIPQYAIVNTFGADIAVPVSSVTFQLEAAWTPDKSAATDTSRTGEPASRIEKTGYLFWDAGATWIVNSNTSVIFEYLEGDYLKNTNRYFAPLFTNLLSLTVTRRLLDDKLTLELKSLYNTAHNDSLLMPSIDWAVKNNLHIKLSSGLFSGSPDTLFGSCDKRDIVSMKVKYYF